MSSSDRTRGIAALLLGGMALAGCGFQPLYGDGGVRRGADAALAQVAIANIPDRYGQQLRNNLVDRFHLSGHPAATSYQLQAGLTAFEQKLAVRDDASAERAQLVVTAPYRLVDSASGRTVFNAVSRAYVSYSVLDAQYAHLATVDNAYDRALVQISDDITTRVALFLNRAP